MNAPPKAITRLTCVQFLFILMGYTLSRKMARLIEKLELPSLYFDRPAAVAFVLGVGLWAFLIPTSWAVWVTLRADMSAGIPVARVIDSRITILLTVLIVAVWSYSAMILIDFAFGHHAPMIPF